MIRDLLDAIDGGAHRERLFLLMDHRANRRRHEVQMAAEEEVPAAVGAEEDPPA
jgi:hypothetical protein